MDNQIKKFTFHPARFNSSAEKCTELATTLLLKPSISPLGLITVYYTNTEYLAMFFWSLGIDQKIKQS